MEALSFSHTKPTNSVDTVTDLVWMSISILIWSCMLNVLMLIINSSCQKCYACLDACVPYAGLSCSDSCGWCDAGCSGWLWRSCWLWSSRSNWQVYAGLKRTPIHLLSYSSTIPTQCNFHKARTNRIVNWLVLNLIPALFFSTTTTPFPSAAGSTPTVFWCTRPLKRKELRALRLLASYRE